MKVTLTRNRQGLYYELTPEDEKIKSIIFQTDWDYPSLARGLGWDMRSIQKCPACGSRDLELNTDAELILCQELICRCIEASYCRHDCTDGTVKCACGLTASDFISAAIDWLDEHDGETFNAPVEDYFQT